MSAFNTYAIGTVVKITGTFTNSAGATVTPNTVRCKYKDPSGNLTSLTYGVDAALLKSDEDVYYVWISADEDGRWPYRFESEGAAGSLQTNKAAAESWFYVAISSFS